MKTQLQRARLPLGNSFQVDAHITILPYNNEYKAYVIVDMGIGRPYSIHLSPHDVKDLNTDLQQAIEQVAVNFDNRAARDEALWKLAHTGNYAFKKVFGDAAFLEKIRQIRSSLKKGTVIQILAEGFFVPWELLYDGPLDKKIDVSGFWGMHHIISRSIVAQEDRPGDFVSSVMQTARPQVGLVAYHELEYVAKHEIPALERFHQGERIQLSRLRPLDTMQRHQELQHFGRFLAGDLHIIHLACHAFEMTPVHDSHLRISNDFSITMKDFTVYGFEVKHNPFVIMNACLTSVINPLYTSFWAAEFWKRGARGVLATDFHVPDWFAASFVEALYQHLLTGQPIGKALFALRQTFWKKQRNPLGLAYALYSSPAIKIAPPS